MINHKNHPFVLVDHHRGDQADNARAASGKTVSEKGQKVQESQANQMVREYPDISTWVVGQADPAAATAIWQAVLDWMAKIEAITAE